MRIWDVSAGYLNRQSLLGEHRELHGLRSILVNGKKGYSRHPETVRWIGCLSGLALRHEALVAEMRLRGYLNHQSPVSEMKPRAAWPSVCVTPVAEQFALLREKYADRQPGRIALPRNAQALWAQHKYSVMARDPTLYRSIGRRVSRLRRNADMAPLADELIDILREAPARGRLVNALEHMWGYVSGDATPDERRAAENDATDLFATTQTIALRIGEPYLVSSTALSELGVFLEPHGS
jgi:hypothetical protein